MFLNLEGLFKNARGFFKSLSHILEIRDLLSPLLCLSKTTNYANLGTTLSPIQNGVTAHTWKTKVFCRRIRL